MRWAELVREGKKLLATESATQWAWGDLALEVEPIGKRGARSGASERLEKWAEEIGWERSLLTLQQLRFVANAWPKETRVAGVSYSTHYALSSLKDRFTLIHPGMKVAEARELAGRAPTKKGEYGVNPERIIKSLRDPGTLGLVLEDAKVRAAIIEALDLSAPEPQSPPFFVRMFQFHRSATV